MRMVHYYFSFALFSAFSLHGSFQILTPTQNFLHALNCRENDTKKLAELLAPVNVNAQFPNGQTPLTRFCDWGDVGRVQFLCSHGANPNLPDKDGVLALHQACTLLNIPMVQTLFAAQADPNIKNSKGIVPLHRMIWRQRDTAQLERREMINTIVATFIAHRRFNLNAVTKKGRTILMCACKAGDLVTTKALLQAGADFTIEDNAGMTAQAHAQQQMKEAADSVTHQKFLAISDAIEAYKSSLGKIIASNLIVIIHEYSGVKKASATPQRKVTKKCIKKSEPMSSKK